MGFHVILVDEQGGGSFGVALGCGNHVLGEFQQALRANILLCADAEYRIGFSCYDSEVESLADFVFGELAGVEEFLHQSVVVFGGLLDELLAEFFRLVAKLGGYFKVFTGAVGVLEMVVFHHEHVHESVESGSGVHGELHIYGLLPYSFLDRSLHVLPVGLFGVKLVDRDDEGEVLALGEAQHVFGSDLEALLGVDHEKSALADLEG